jgi:predicted nucleic acid-binding Zn ribbon protein
VDDDPRPLKESLDRVARDLGVPNVEVLTGVFSHWSDIVGASVAAHARPVSLRDGTLHVVVDQPGWATQLRYLASEIVTRCEEVLGASAVRSLEVRVDPKSGA